MRFGGAHPNSKLCIRAQIRPHTQSPQGYRIVPNLGGWRSTFVLSVASTEASSADGYGAVSPIFGPILEEVCVEPGNLPRCRGPRRLGGWASSAKLVQPTRRMQAAISSLRGDKPHVTREAIARRTDGRGEASIICLAQPNGLIVPHKSLLACVGGVAVVFLRAGFSAAIRE